MESDITRRKFLQITGAAFGALTIGTTISRTQTIIPTTKPDPNKALEDIMVKKVSAFYERLGRIGKRSQLTRALSNARDFFKEYAIRDEKCIVGLLNEERSGLLFKWTDYCHTQEEAEQIIDYFDKKGQVAAYIEL